MWEFFQSLKINFQKMKFRPNLLKMKKVSKKERQCNFSVLRKFCFAENLTDTELLKDGVSFVCVFDESS